jgi:uncharacterized protein (UPF0335 family)
MTIPNTDPDLLRIVERIESLQSALKDATDDIKGDIKDLKAEAKAKGFNMKALNAVLALRAKDSDTRADIGLYADQLGVFG